MQSIFVRAAQIFAGAARFCVRAAICASQQRFAIAALAIAAGGLLVASLGVGFAATALSQYAQEPQQTQPAIELLPPARQHHYPRCELAECSEERTLITPVPEEMVLEALSERLCPSQKHQTWQQWIVAQLPVPVPETESKPLNNELALNLMCWQAFASVSEGMKAIKASEMKAIAAELRIRKYRQMNKS